MLHRTRWSLVAVVALLALATAACIPATGPRDRRLEGANGVARHDGALWVADLNHARLVVVDPATGRIERGWDVGDGIDAPDDLAFASDGSAYVASPNGNSVTRFAPDGTHKKVAAITGANPIAVSADDRVFVGREVGGDIYEIDPTGVLPPRVVRPYDGALINGFAFGSDGALYVPRFEFLGSVERIDVDTGARTTVTTGIALPAALKVGPDGMLYVLQSFFGPAIWRVDPSTGAKVKVATIHRDVVDNLAIASDGTFFVSGFSDGTITEIRPDGGQRTFVPGP